MTHQDVPPIDPTPTVAVEDKDTPPGQDKANRETERESFVGYTPRGESTTHARIQAERHRFRTVFKIFLSPPPAPPEISIYLRRYASPRLALRTPAQAFNRTKHNTLNKRPAHTPAPTATLIVLPEKQRERENATVVPRPASIESAHFLVTRASFAHEDSRWYTKLSTGKSRGLLPRPFRPSLSLLVFQPPPPAGSCFRGWTAAFSVPSALSHASASGAFLVSCT